eukprot:2780750-Rhodomonas_salina.1
MAVAMAVAVAVAVVVVAAAVAVTTARVFAGESCRHRCPRLCGTEPLPRTRTRTHTRTRTRCTGLQPPNRISSTRELRWCCRQRRSSAESGERARRSSAESTHRTNDSDSAAEEVELSHQRLPLQQQPGHAPVLLFRRCWSAVQMMAERGGWRLGASCVGVQAVRQGDAALLVRVHEAAVPAAAAADARDAALAAAAGCRSADAAAALSLLSCLRGRCAL